MNDRLKGVFIPVVTPFTDQKVDLDKLAYNIQKSNLTSVKGYMPLGSNGEFAHMNDDEQISVFKTVKENMVKDKVLMVGIARQSAYCTIEFGKRIEDMGADFVSVLCPSYFASFMDDSALIRYYTAVADGLSIPVLLYNCPKFASGVTISPEVVRTLSAHPNILGMKDTSSGNIGKYLAVKDENFDVLAGSITNFLDGLKAGASGGVLSMANYLQEPCCSLYELYVHGRLEEADALSDKLIRLSKNATDKYSVAGVKAACDIFGYKGGEVRNPLADCTDEQREMIKAAFIGAGYL
ncbi:dihydrodipicolinate synthase family protein [Mahella australiensis]|uniref:Dihydrodipicolinate synthetase n=1 Tax=Mahella australiensis (strain DSM 15567 / CIP 107919 / 50-1 BON) TaxID=697281 RepID=F3ZWR1_MAHA5|nr:dihydrodipicolinate synthase family protein [Mahella australiensis]AEE96504.1 dihydrodipicolinate synthetase [Mahella australiensis 50-1 BON]